MTSLKAKMKFIKLEILLLTTATITISSISLEKLILYLTDTKYKLIGNQILLIKMRNISLKQSLKFL